MAVPTLTAPPPPVPQREPWLQRSKLATGLIVAFLGTGGCAGILTGTAAVLGALKPDMGPVVERLDRHERKLDEIREDQLSDKAQISQNKQKIDALLDDKEREHKSEVDSYRKQLRLTD